MPQNRNIPKRPPRMTRARPRPAPQRGSPRQPRAKPCGSVSTIKTHPSPERAAYLGQPRPESPFQGSGTTRSQIRGAMPRAVLGRPLGAKEALVSADPEVQRCSPYQPSPPRILTDLPQVRSTDRH
jgi:hypothetical protein